MEKDTAVSCDTATHRSYQLLASLCIVFYGLFVPGFAAYKCHKVRRRRRRRRRRCCTHCLPW